MTRKSRKVVKIQKKRLPKTFLCPKCGAQTISIELFADANSAIVSCRKCGIKEEFCIKPAHGEIDVYCMFTDKIYGR